MEKYFILLFLSMALRLQAVEFNYDYSQVWTSKMFLAKPDGKGGSEVNLTFEQALELIRQTNYLTLDVPKIIYLVGWQYNGHDDKYPAFFEVNPALKRKEDPSARESLQWLMREAKKYNTIVSLHINMTDAYDDSPLWEEYVANDLITKNAGGDLKVIGVYNNHNAYQINYRNEWEKGYTQMRIDRLLDLFPELKAAGTIHLDAWIARPSEGHNESVVVEAEYQKKALLYWKAKGLDVTSEWVMDYMTGYVPFAWHFNGFTQPDYLSVPANVYTGAGINKDIAGDHALAFLFGTSCYGETFWKMEENNSWIENLTRDFMLNCPQYFYLNRLKRLGVEGTGDNRLALFEDKVQVSLSDSTVRHRERIVRRKDTISIPAVWRDDDGIILYTTACGDNYTFDIPFNWGNTKEATLYRITTEGLQTVEKVRIRDQKLQIKIATETPYYVLPN